MPARGGPSSLEAIERVGMSGNDYRYWAFVSYSHRDRAWGEWLQRSIETWRVPRRLVGMPGATGPAPRRLAPVFRDQDELPSSADLGGAIDLALRQSRYLIVIASPYAAVSRWVGQEIERFRMLGRGDRILCLIVDGEPNAGSRYADGQLECLPPGLRGGGGVEPIAADVRPGHDGLALARAKLLAGVLGIGLDELRQREQRRLRLRWALGSCVAVAVAAVLLAGVRALRQESASALAQQARAVHLQHVMDAGRSELKQHHAARAATYFAEAYRLGVDGPAFRYQLGRAMQFVDARERVIDTGAPVQLLRFSHDQTSVMTIGENHRIQVWDIASGMRRVEVDPGDYHWFCQLSLDDALIGCSVDEQFDRLRIWDAVTGKLMADLPTKPDGAARVMFGRDGRAAFIGPDLHPRLHRVGGPDGSLRLPVEASVISFDGNGAVLLVGTDRGEVSLWDAATGRILHRLPGLEAPINWVDSSRDGQRIAAADQSGALRIWDTADGRIRLISSHTTNKVGTGFDQAGRNILSESTDGVRVWDVASGALKFALRTNSSNSTESRLSPGGDLIYSSGTDELRAHYVDAWCQAYAVDGHLSAANDMDFSADGRMLATGSTDGRVILWRLPQEPEVEFAHGAPRPAILGDDQVAGAVGIYSHDGRLIATSGNDGAVRLWDARSHVLLRQFDNVDPLAVDVLAFGPDDRTLAAGGDSGGISLWSLPDGRPLRRLDTGGKGVLWIGLSGDRVFASWTGHRSGAWQLSDGSAVGEWDRDYGQALAPDGQTFATGYQGTVSLRRTGTLEILWTHRVAAGESIAALAFSGDGKSLVIADSAHALTLLDAGDGHARAQTRIAGGIRSYGVAVSDDGSVVAEADTDRNALLWWPLTGRQLELRGHGGMVISAAFSPDQKMVLTTSQDGTARLWEVETGLPVETVASHAQPFATSPFVGGRFAPDGHSVLTASMDGAVRQWRLPAVTLDADAVSRRVECSAPWRLDGETLVPKLPPAGDCRPSGAPAPASGGEGW